MKNLMKKLDNLELSIKEFGEALAFVIERDILKGGPGSGRRAEGGFREISPAEEGEQAMREENQDRRDRAQKIRESMSNEITNYNSMKDDIEGSDYTDGIVSLNRENPSKEGKEIIDAWNEFNETTNPKQEDFDKLTKLIGLYFN